MWSVVHFVDDNTVQVVPAHWAQKNKCAWPKKDPIKLIKKRALYNQQDFNFLRSRILKKNIGNKNI